ncbi:hypothetical protein AXG89_41535 (plasmid) [Burkholderia sp. PAMC 26561]|nr:hypothetical protein AXG89_41515 [Burkholderia sp. PAMC 26561]AMH42810.1 hypothetical protein AXG89_41535 [Burkholderia sp. PAMC 26561]
MHTPRPAEAAEPAQGVQAQVGEPARAAVPEQVEPAREVPAADRAAAAQAMAGTAVRALAWEHPISPARPAVQ